MLMPRAVEAGQDALQSGRGRGCRDLFIVWSGGHLPAAKFLASRGARDYVLHP